MGYNTPTQTMFSKRGSASPAQTNFIPKFLKKKPSNYWNNSRRESLQNVAILSPVSYRSQTSKKGLRVTNMKYGDYTTNHSPKVFCLKKQSTKIFN